MLDPYHFALTRPLECQDVISAFDPFHRIRMEFLLAAVKAGLDDEKRPGCARVVDHVEVPRQRRILVRDGDDLVRDGIEREGIAERFPALFPRLHDAGIGGITMQKELGSAVICRGPVVCFHCGNPVPGCEALVTRGSEGVRGPVPFAVPTFEVSFRDPGCRGETLADIGLSRIRGADCPLELEGEFLIHKHERRAVTGRCGGPSDGRRRRGLLAGPGAACRNGKKNGYEKGGRDGEGSLVIHVAHGKYCNRSDNGYENPVG